MERDLFQQENMEKIENDVVTQQPKFNYRGVKAMPFIIGNEVFEKLGSTGTSANLLVYLTAVFQMKSITATTIVNVFNGTSNFATLIGAFLCDTYLGRYKTLAFACVASLLGMVVLALTAAIGKLHPPKCTNLNPTTTICNGPTPWQLTVLSIAFGLLIIGAGGIRPCNLAFGADQFNPNTSSGKRGINSFFSWYYFTYTFAAMVSITSIVYVQSEVSWAWGLAIPAFLMFFSCILFFVGSPIYVKVKPEGSALVSVVRVVVAAVKKRKLKLPAEHPTRLSLFSHIPTTSINSILSYSNQFRFLDKAAIITSEDEVKLDGSAANPWRLCSMQQVEEVKCLIRVIPIWTTGILYYAAMTPQATYVVFQALQSDRRFSKHTNFKIPPASYIIFTMVAVTVWIPIYDQLLVPILRRVTGRESGITLLQRMGLGMVIVVFTMFLSALVEVERRKLAIKAPIGIQIGRGAISSMSGWWLVPQLTLSGISEAFTSIAQIEFYYKQFPENMRSTGSSFMFVGIALSGYLSGFLVSIVHHTTKDAKTGDWLPEDLNKGRLEYFYYFLTALGIINLGYFIVCAKWFKYKEPSNRTEAEVELVKNKSEEPKV